MLQCTANGRVLQAIGLNPKFKLTHYPAPTCFVLRAICSMAAPCFLVVDTLSRMSRPLCMTHRQIHRLASFVLILETFP
jgi:hypothetical protein